MKNKFFKILAAAVVLSLLMIAIPVTPAIGAVGIIDITAPAGNYGPVGTVVTLTCTGFTVGQPYTVSFGGTAMTTGTTGTSPFTATFTVPSRVRGDYTVAISVTGDTSNTETFSVVPEITFTPITSVHVGDTVTVAGTGFAASISITVRYDSTSMGTTTTNSSGVFSSFTFTVPACTEGNHALKAEETSAITNYDTETVEVDPKITINPTTGSVGDTITVTGNGFDGSSSLTIYFDTTTMTTASTNSSGTLSSATFVVPSTSRGTHTVKVQDAGSNYATTTFSVSTKITINPASGPSGTTVTVTGTGFAGSSTVTITYAGTAVVTNPSSVVTGSTGGFTATFVVPVSPVGTYVVSASAGSDTATANFQSTTDATIDPVTSVSAPGNVGMSLTIEGVGFLPNHTITVTYATDPVTLATTTSDASGNFTVTFTIPPSVGGAHVITVSDGTITKTFEFYMETNAPPTPEMTLPLADTKLKDKTFTWEAVEDVSPPSAPITYDLQVASDADFTTTSTLIDKTGLAATSYTIPDEEELESTSEEAPYYWRVRAVDAASNTSVWSEAVPFTTGWSFEFTGWVVWVTLIVVAIAFFFFGLWVGRRAGGGGGFY